MAKKQTSIRPDAIELSGLSKAMVISNIVACDVAFIQHMRSIGHNMGKSVYFSASGTRKSVEATPTLEHTLICTFL